MDEQEGEGKIKLSIVSENLQPTGEVYNLKYNIQ